MECVVGKGSPEWEKHRIQAVVGVGEWQCKDCDVKIPWTRELQVKWAAWVQRILKAADGALDG